MALLPARRGGRRIGQHLRDLADLALLVDVAHGDVGSAGSAQGRGQPRGEEGMAAQSLKKSACSRWAPGTGWPARRTGLLGWRFGQSDRRRHRCRAGAGTVGCSGSAFRVLRSILPEVRRGMASRNCNGPAPYGGRLGPARPARAAPRCGAARASVGTVPVPALMPALMPAPVPASATR
jgi:hypothetical protein